MSKELFDMIAANMIAGYMRQARAAKAKGRPAAVAHYVRQARSVASEARQGVIITIPLTVA